MRGAAARERRWIAEVSGWAAACGWAFQEYGGREEDWFAYLPKGDGDGEVRLQASGLRDGRAVTVADYRYKDTRQSDNDGVATKSTSTTELTVVVARLAERHSRVWLQPRVFGKLGISVSRAFGREPRNLTGIGDFDRRYQIGGDAAQVTPAIMRAMMTEALPFWQVQGHELIVTWGGEVRAASLDHQVAQALRLAALLDAAVGE